MKCPVCKMNIRCSPVEKLLESVVGDYKVRLAIHGDCKGSGLIMMRKIVTRKKP